MMLMTVLARYAGENTTGSTPWYQKGMEWAKANGVSDGTNPEVNITREQLVTMLYRYAGSPKANGSLDSFSDAASVSSYAVNAMQWAVANGIVNGFTDGSFRPDQAVSRQEIAAFLYRYAQYKGYDTTRGGMAIREFTDYDAISAYALSAMDWCVNAGVLQGSAAKRLNPQSPASRAHVAAMLSRFCRSVQN